eukprot:2597823-Pyramimonas_sp.AAC.1
MLGHVHFHAGAVESAAAAYMKALHLSDYGCPVQVRATSSNLVIQGYGVDGYAVDVKGYAVDAKQVFLRLGRSLLSAGKAEESRRIFLTACERVRYTNVTPAGPEYAERYTNDIPAGPEYAEHYTNDTPAGPEYAERYTNDTPAGPEYAERYTNVTPAGPVLVRLGGAGARVPGPADGAAGGGLLHRGQPPRPPQADGVGGPGPRLPPPGKQVKPGTLKPNDPNR